MSLISHSCQDSSGAVVSPTTIGRKIRRVRQLRGWTQKDLAQAAGCSQTIVSDVERGHYQLAKQWFYGLPTLLGLPTPTVEDTPPFELEAEYIAGDGRCRVCSAVLFSDPANVPDGWIVEWHTAAPDGLTCLEHVGMAWAKYGVGQ